MVKLRQLTYVAEAASAVTDTEELAVLHTVLTVPSLHRYLLFIFASSRHREPILKHHIVQLYDLLVCFRKQKSRIETVSYMRCHWS